MATYTIPNKSYVTLKGMGAKWTAGDHIEHEGAHCIVTGARLYFSEDSATSEHDVMPVKWEDGRWVFDADSPLLGGA